ncbi:MAG: chromosomal replication initiator protein DnaA [Phycisphaerae bacterium]|nr:chromosomal replication initiator protein DnaA [Phycisphaerae bacterium]
MPRPDPEFRVSINGYLRKHHPDLCRHWFDDIEPLDIQSGVLRLVVREPVQLRYLQRCCTAQFSEAAQSVTGRLLVVRFIGPEEASAPTPNADRDGSGRHRSAGRSANTSHHGRSDTDHHGLLSDGQLPTSRGSNPDGLNADGQGSTGQGSSDRLPESQPGIPSGLTELKPSGQGSGLLSAGFGSGSADHDDAGSVFAAMDEQTLLSPDYSFENFVVGPNNRLAHAAGIAVGEKPGKAYNPYFVHGGVGLGKTHLLQAICQTILRKNNRARICYISCNTFMDLFHDAVKAGRMSDFRSRFRTVDVLVIDDIHFLSKREQTQEEFFHTFNTLYQAGKQIVLSSDAAPSEIPDLEERLTSRFSCGLVARIDRPDYETRVSIVKTKAALHDLVLPDDVPAYIAAKIDSNIRELEGALTKLRGLSAATGLPINLDLAKQALSDINPSGGASQPTIQMIIEEVSRFFDVKLTDLLSKRRHKSIALPRQVCMWLARKHTRYSLEEIGGYFGGRDHTTVMHAIKTINEKRGADGKLLADVSRLEEQLLQRVR